MLPMLQLKTNVTGSQSEKPEGFFLIYFASSYNPLPSLGTFLTVEQQVSAGLALPHPLRPGQAAQQVEHTLRTGNSSWDSP